MSAKRLILTTDHAASSYGQPVAIWSDNPQTAYGVADRIPGVAHAPAAEIFRRRLAAGLDAADAALAERFVSLGYECGVLPWSE